MWNTVVIVLQIIILKIWSIVLQIIINKMWSTNGFGLQIIILKSENCRLCASNNNKKHVEHCCYCASKNNTKNVEHCASKNSLKGWINVVTMPQITI